MMGSEEEMEVEAPPPLMNLEEDHNPGAGGNKVHDDKPSSSSSSWTKKKKLLGALALASVAILAVVIGAGTAKNDSNKHAVASAAMNFENCMAIMKKLELDEPSPAPSTYEPTTYIPTTDPTDPPVLALSNDVSDLLDGPVRGRDLRGGRSSKSMPENEARVSSYGL